MAGNGSFMVDLAALSHAIGKVSAHRDAMKGGIQGLRTTFNNVADIWLCPAGTTFVSATAHFNSVTDNLTSLLDDAIGRMQTAHDNYVSAETTNTSNLQ